MSWFSPQYRVWRTKSGYYEAQIKYWFWPFWVAFSVFLDDTPELAEMRARNHVQVRAAQKKWRAGPVKYLGRLEEMNK